MEIEITLFMGRPFLTNGVTMLTIEWCSVSMSV
jgi:hypothetical protein